MRIFGFDKRLFFLGADKFSPLLWDGREPELF